MQKRIWGRCAALTAQRPKLYTACTAPVHLRRPAQRGAASEADGAKDHLGEL